MPRNFLKTADNLSDNDSFEEALDDNIRDFSNKDQEILEICSLNPHLIPTFDFGHINALTQGGLKSCDDYLKIFSQSIELIGFDKTSNCHIHFSKIQYGEKGEIRHLNFDDNIYGPDFEHLAEALIKLNLHPRILSESAGHMAEDALEMKTIYEKTLAQQL